MTITKPALRIVVPTLLGVAVVSAALVAALRGGVSLPGGGTTDVEIPGGTALVGTLGHTVSTEVSRVGDEVVLRVSDPVRVGDQVVIPEGALVYGEVTHSKRGGRIAGAPALTLRFTALVINGKRYSIGSAPFRVTGKSDATESAVQIGGGAAVGAVLGRVLGSDAGDALKGAAAGAVVGTGVAVATKGDHIVLPAGQRLRIRLAAPVTVALERES